MEFRHHLLRMVTHDEYATGVWLEYLDSVSSRPNGAQLAAEADKWLWHIVGCYRSWYDCLTRSELANTDDVRESMAVQRSRLKDFIEKCNLEAVLERDFDDWGLWNWSYADVIFHTLSHSTYHRGHLRALAEAHGFDDWPETDWELFAGKQLERS